jgi:hypothetical protein
MFCRAGTTFRATMRAVRVLVCLLLAGCTVPLGNTPDAAPCAPSTRFFVSDVWPSYIEHNQCATSDCHAFSGGHGYLRYLPAGIAPDPLTTFSDWPSAWQANYHESVQLVRCDDPLQSRLLTVPEGKGDFHPQGDSVDAPAVAEQLFQDWINAP